MKAINAFFSNKIVVNIVTALAAIVVGGGMSVAVLKPDYFWDTVTGGYLKS